MTGASNQGLRIDLTGGQSRYVGGPFYFNTGLINSLIVDGDVIIIRDGVSFSMYEKVLITEGKADTNTADISNLQAQMDEITSSVAVYDTGTTSIIPPVNCKYIDFHLFGAGSGGQGSSSSAPYANSTNGIGGCAGGYCYNRYETDGSPISCSIGEGGVGGEGGQWTDLAVLINTSIKTGDIGADGESTTVNIDGVIIEAYYGGTNTGGSYNNAMFGTAGNINTGMFGGKNKEWYLYGAGGDANTGPLMTNTVGLWGNGVNGDNGLDGKIVCIFHNDFKEPDYLSRIETNTNDIDQLKIDCTDISYDTATDTTTIANRLVISNAVISCHVTHDSTIVHK